MLTEAQAWREIAERCDRDEWDEFLCNFVNALYFHESKIGATTHSSMLARVEQHLRDGGTYESTVAKDGNCPWDDHREVMQGRTLAALFLALEAEDEANA